MEAKIVFLVLETGLSIIAARRSIRKKHECFYLLLLEKLLGDVAMMYITRKRREKEILRLSYLFLVSETSVHIYFFKL